MRKIRKKLGILLVGALILAVATGSALAISRTSLRLDGMSDDLTYFISDEYSDLFLNPANVMEIDGVRIYTNLSNLQGEPCFDKFLDQNNCDGTTTYWESELLLGGIFSLKNLRLGAIAEMARRESTEEWKSEEKYDYEVDNHYTDYYWNDPLQPPVEECSYDASIVGTETESYKESEKFDKSEWMPIFGYKTGNLSLGFRLHLDSVDISNSWEYTYSDEGTETYTYSDETWDYGSPLSPPTAHEIVTADIDNTYSYSYSESEDFDLSLNDTLFAVGLNYDFPSFRIGATFEQSKSKLSVNETWYEWLWEGIEEGETRFFYEDYINEWKGEIDYEGVIELWYDCCCDLDWDRWPNWEIQRHRKDFGEYTEDLTDTKISLSLAYPWSTEWTLKGFGQSISGSGDYNIERKYERSWDWDTDFALVGTYTDYAISPAYVATGDLSFSLIGGGDLESNLLIDSGNISWNGFNAGIGTEFNKGTTVIGLGVKVENYNWNSSGEVQPIITDVNRSREGELDWAWGTSDPPTSDSGWGKYSYESEGTCNNNRTISYEANGSTQSLIVPVGVEFMPFNWEKVRFRLGASTRITRGKEKIKSTTTDKEDTFVRTETESWSYSDGYGETYTTTWNADTSYTIVEEYTGPATCDNYTVTEEYDTEGNCTITYEYADGTTYTYYYPNPCPTDTETTVTTDTEEWSNVSTRTTYSFGASYMPTENIRIDLMHFSNLAKMQKWILSVTFLFK